ncbi:branched-chain amino acid ABC transporter permease [Streptomyces sp. RLB3-17]|uniref:branched-chain amino acid ABC transporter permease n=1 Tax=unclassified Streptomyces TaxID=2593676 RepID=UPI001163728B|nr:MULTISPECIES: branched-chain amino acid ABC transporter permease [unclassified Streptomyces]NMI54313.1 branched-chain amino acid ABC transporter permease [Streptomyces sp. RLA2-12]QDN63101.1 branched-chain amino acid ABC transporter permease [Streptomyces sp. S1D4-20]QDN73153.1 branched-chain amino acid ABC transporter permease [Streptomyces sp. S1D4-14]QDO03863.1 branched-chain amino acid ABC transporter permease [Streptomyces sp. RLB1-9]QDO25594.1 branched-chain amino acid ABC transporter
MTFDRLSRTPAFRLGLPLLICACFPLLVHTSWILNLGVLTIMYAALGSSWNLLGGFTGYISLGHAAFFGFGAYSLALLGGPDRAALAGYGPFLLVPLIAVAAAVMAAPIGWVVLRARHVAFAIVTITFLFMAQALAFNLTGVTHGSAGLTAAVAPFAPDGYEAPFYFAMLVILAVAVTLFEVTRRAPLGLALTAVREDEDKARGVGVPTTAIKVMMYCVSVSLTAAAGAVWAYYISFILPQYAVDPLLMVGTVLMVFLGGKGTLWGPTIGALAIAPVQEYLAYSVGASQFYLVGYAALFLAVILLLPRGILPTVGEWLRRRRGTRREPWPAEAASPQTPTPDGTPV